MNYEYIILEVDSERATALIRLNRPQKKNALNTALRGEMTHCIDALCADDGVHAIVITGNDNCFSAGLDLAEVMSVDDENKEQFLDSVRTMFSKMALCPKPTISAISGPAFAGGFDLSCLCDIRIASDTARFQQTEVIHGITQIISPHWMCVGLNRIKEIALTGCVIGADEAFRIGLVNHVYPVSEYFDRAMDMARAIAGYEPRAVQASKAMIDHCITMDIETALEYQFLVISRFFGSKYSKAPAGAFVKKEKK